jgi:hypothetical protein
MLKKLAWLRTWLRASAQPLLSMTDPDSFFWLASGGVALQRTSSQARRLAQEGLTFPREHLTL